LKRHVGVSDAPMIRWPRLTPRQFLIVAHDLVVTVAAILATVMIRFETISSRCGSIGCRSGCRRS